MKCLRISLLFLVFAAAPAAGLAQVSVDFSSILSSPSALGAMGGMVEPVGALTFTMASGFQPSTGTQISGMSGLPSINWDEWFRQFTPGYGSPAGGVVDFTGLLGSGGSLLPSGSSSQWDYAQSGMWTEIPGTSVPTFYAWAPGGGYFITSLDLVSRSTSGSPGQSSGAGSQIPSGSGSLIPPWTGFYTGLLDLTGVSGSPDLFGGLPGSSVGGVLPSYGDWTTYFPMIPFTGFQTGFSGQAGDIPSVLNDLSGFSRTGNQQPAQTTTGGNPGGSMGVSTTLTFEIM